MLHSMNLRKNGLFSVNFITEAHLDQIIKESIKKYADSKWLGFIIDQIIANALKYTGDDGDISIKVEEDNKEKRLLIQDSGIGIKAEDIQRVFDKGFTGSNGRSHVKSTGMGLYLAKQA
jgi:signal transduction histidine kinase